MAEAKIAGSYGVDAPRVPVVSAIGGVAFVVYGFFGGGGLGVLLGLLLFGQAALYLHTANRGRFVLWARILGDAGLEGDERVLDVGCGRGLVAVTAARLVPDGRVVALDQWRDQARTGIGPDLARSNARANGVEDRIDVVTGDPTAVDAKRGSFDLVVSNLPFQAVRDRELRAAVAGRDVPGGPARWPDPRGRDPARQALRRGAHRARGFRGHRHPAGVGGLVGQPLLRQPRSSRPPADPSRPRSWPIGPPGALAGEPTRRGRSKLAQSARLGARQVSQLGEGGVSGRGGGGRSRARRRPTGRRWRRRGRSVAAPAGAPAARR